MGDGNGGKAGELEFADWYERRFPDPQRDLRRRIRDRWLFFLLLVVPLAVVVGTASGYLVDEALDRLDGNGQAPADGRAALALLGWVLVAAGVGLVVVGLRRARRRDGEPPMLQRNALQALTARQKWQLFAELRGKRPAPDKDLPVLRHLARGWVRDGRTTPIALGLALLVVAAGLLADLGLVTTVIGALLMLAAAAGLIRNARAGRAFLEATAPRPGLAVITTHDQPST